MSQYTKGTVQVVFGDATLTGTSWLSEVSPGDLEASTIYNRAMDIIDGLL